MSVLAIKEFVRAGIVANTATILANQTPQPNAGPSNFQTVIIFRQVPKYEKLGTGLFIVIGPVTRDERRKSGNRGPGWKRLTYALKIWMYAVVKDEEAGGDDFDTVWENLSRVLASLNTQVLIQDPLVAGAPGQSWLHAIAEEQHDSTEEPTLGKQSGMTKFFAEKIVTAIEDIQG